MDSKKIEPLLKRRGLLAALCTLGATASMIIKEEEGTAYAATQDNTVQPALYWASKNVVTQSNGPTLDDWWNAVVVAMQQLGLQGVSKNPYDVNGGTPDALAAVTFIPLGDGLTYTAVIMVAGNNANEAMQLRTNLLNNIQIYFY